MSTEADAPVRRHKTVSSSAICGTLPEIRPATKRVSFKGRCWAQAFEAHRTVKARTSKAGELHRRTTKNYKIEHGRIRYAQGASDLSWRYSGGRPGPRPPPSRTHQTVA